MKKFTLLILVSASIFSYFYLRKKHDWPVKNSPSSARAVVAFGDSLTFGKGAEKNESYPAILESKLGITIKNMGKNGETTTSALKKIERVKAEEPDLVLITLGGNDLMRKLPSSETISNLEKIFTELQDLGALVVYLAIKPPLSSSKWVSSIEDVCEKHGVLYVPTIMKGLWTKPSLMSDTIHPNSRGYKIIAQRVLTILNGHVILEK